MEEDKLKRCKLILDGTCPECEGSLALSDSKESSTCVECGSSYDLQAIRLKMGCDSMSK